MMDGCCVEVLDLLNLPGGFSESALSQESQLESDCDNLIEPELVQLQ